MRKIVLKYFIVFLLVIGSGSTLMNISQHVQRAHREIKSYDKKIAYVQEEIRVLNAEWAYLNNPVRLEILASKGLYLTSPNVVDLISDLSVDSKAQDNITPSPSRSPMYRDISYAPLPRANISPNEHSNSSINNSGGAQ